MVDNDGVVNESHAGDGLELPDLPSDDYRDESGKQERSHQLSRHLRMTHAGSNASDVQLPMPALDTVDGNMSLPPISSEPSTEADGESHCTSPDDEDREYDPVTGKLIGWELTHDRDYVLTTPGDDAMLDFDIDEILEYGIDIGASDVHIYPDRHITYRINGDMYKSNRFRMVDGMRLDDITQNSHWMNQQQLSEFRENTSVDYGYSLGESTQLHHPGERFRVHWGQSMDYPYAVYRHINPEIFTPEQIGLRQDVLDWGWLDQGLILVTGPTGSGKSATLATLLREVQLHRSVKICTLEAPIETIYPSDGISMVQQRGIPDDCHDFEDGIRDAMREDPDILLIGEIRDKETLDAALESCNTGHLTFATLHANSTADIISRIYSWFEPSEVGRIQDELSHNLKGALAQRLIKNANGDGRIAIRETMMVDETIQKCIARNDVNGIKKHLHRNNTDMPRQFLQMLLRQETTLDQARNILSGTELKLFREDYDKTPEDKKKRILQKQPETK